MKVIDLLNKIANGEVKNGTRFVIKWKNGLERYIYYDENELCFNNMLKNESDDYPIYDEVLLNDDIIEELDIPGITITEEKLEPINIEEFLQVRKTKKILFLANKINEIIRHINKDSDKE